MKKLEFSLLHRAYKHYNISESDIIIAMFIYDMYLRYDDREEIINFMNYEYGTSKEKVSEIYDEIQRIENIIDSEEKFNNPYRIEIHEELLKGFFMAFDLHSYADKELNKSQYKDFHTLTDVMEATQYGEDDYSLIDMDVWKKFIDENLVMDLVEITSDFLIMRRVFGSDIMFEDLDEDREMLIDNIEGEAFDTDVLVEFFFRDGQISREASYELINDLDL